MIQMGWEGVRAGVGVGAGRRTGRRAVRHRGPPGSFREGPCADVWCRAVSYQIASTHSGWSMNGFRFFW
ncbi:hypothetical protein SAURM35S_08970 [Streptomyces aurantiogriseus]